MEAARVPSSARVAYVSSVGREAICLSIYNPGEPVSLMPCRWEPYRHAIATVLLNSANDLRIPASRAPVSAKPASGAYEPNLLRLRAEVPSTGAVMAGERAVPSPQPRRSERPHRSADPVCPGSCGEIFSTWLVRACLAQASASLWVLLVALAK